MFLVLLFSISAAAQANSLTGDLSLRQWDLDLEHGYLAPRGHLSLLGRIDSGEAVWFGARVDLMIESPFVIRDNSSNVFVALRPAGWSENDHISLSVFPFSSERLHLGFAYPLTWGRTLYVDGLPATSAATLDFSRGRWRAFVGAKSQNVSDAVTREPVRAWMGFAGAGASLPAGFELDLHGGWGPQRSIPRLASNGIEAQHLERGLTARVAHGSGLEQEPILDLTFDGRDPAYFDRVAARPKYGEGVSTFVGLEATQLWNNLWSDPSGDPAGHLVTDTGTAFALDARVQFGRGRAQALVGQRSASFVRDYETYPYPFASIASEQTEPNWFAHLAADYSFASVGLTPGAAFTWSLPASLLIPRSASSPLAGDDAVLFHDGTIPGLAAPGVPRGAVVGGQLLLRWDPHQAITVLVQAGVQHDPNASRYVDAAEGQTIFPDPRTTWSGAIVMQGRY